MLSIAQTQTGRGEEDIARSEEYVRAQKQIEEREAAAAELQKELDERLRVQREVDSAKAELEAVERSIDMSADAVAQAEELRARLTSDAEALKKQIEDLKAKQTRIAIEQDTIEERITQKKENAPEPTLMIQPSGARSDQISYFVEAAKDKAVIFRPNGERIEVPAGQVRSSPELKQLAEFVAKNPKAVIIFLIREDGIPTYFNGKQVADAIGARSGRLPLVGNGPIDLSLFQKGGR